MKHLEHLARRLEDDPFFLACPLTRYALSEGLDDAGLARAFGCSRQALVQVRLCRAPAAEDPRFRDHLAHIARKFAVDGDVLVEAVRRGQALFAFSGGGSASGTLLAAR